MTMALSSNKSKQQQWIHTSAALKTLMENFDCNKCKLPAHESIRYQKCGHLFCAGCIGSHSQCPACETPARRSEVHSDLIVPKLITYSRTIAYIIKPSRTPTKKDDSAKSSTFSIQDPDVSLRSQNVPKNINKRNTKGETRLHRACVKPDINTVRSLLQAGADPNTKDNSYWTPLQEAASFGYYDICELLLQAEASLDTPGFDNRTALHEAVERNDLELIKLLRQYSADLNAPDCYGKTPLDYAASEEARKILLNNEPMDTILENSLANTSNIKQLSNSTSTHNGVNVLGLNLSSESSLLLTEVANKHKIKIVKTFIPAVTHVVVEVNDQQITPLNYEILLAILHGKWILTDTWLRYSLSIADLSIIELDLFEVHGTGTSRSNAPARARQNTQKQNPRLFNGCHFFFAMNDYSTYAYDRLEFTKSTLSRLIIEGDGKVLKREPDPELIQTCKEIPFHVGRDLTHPLHRCSHYIIYNPGQDEPRIKYKMPHIKSLPLIWLIESIEQFELMDPTYLGT